jgi:hypothetical protein
VHARDTVAPAQNFHLAAPDEPHSAIQLDVNNAGTTIDSDLLASESGHSVSPHSPASPHHHDHLGVGPDKGGPRPLLGPRWSPRDHTGGSDAAQGGVRPHGESASWCGEPGPCRSGCRLDELARARSDRSQRRPLVPKRPARARRAARAGGPGAGAASRAQGSPGGGAACPRSGDGLAREG